MPPKYITVCGWQCLHTSNYGFIYCVTIMPPCCTINHVCTLDLPKFFLNLGECFTRLGLHKTSIFSSLCHSRETQLQLEHLCSEDTPAAPLSPILLICIGSLAKTRQNQSYKFIELAKSSFFSILQIKIQMPHLLRLPDNLGKYEMDLVSIAQLAPMSFYTSIPHKPRQVRWGWVHASVVTEWSSLCLFQLLIGLHHKSN